MKRHRTLVCRVNILSYQDCGIKYIWAYVNKKNSMRKKRALRKPMFETHTIVFATRIWRGRQSKSETSRVYKIGPTCDNFEMAMGLPLTNDRAMLGPRNTSERCKRFAITGIFSAPCEVFDFG